MWGTDVTPLRPVVATLSSRSGRYVVTTTSAAGGFVMR